MPEPISKLYAENKRIQAENKATYDNPFADIISPLVKPKPLSSITVRPGEQSPTEPISAYSDYMNEPAMVESYGDINMMRAENQSFGEQLGHVALRALVDIPLGAAANLASMVDFEDYFNADAEVGNAISNTLGEWQDKWKAANPIYREKPGETFDLNDSGWWMDNVGMLLDSAGAFALAGVVSGAAIGQLGNLLGKGAVSLRGAANIEKAAMQEVKAAQAAGAQLTDDAIAKIVEGAKSAYIGKVGGIAATPINAIALNQAESIMESTGVYKDVYNEKLAEGKSPDEAKQIAADAASLNINLNRGNFVLNMTSAGLFTKSAKAIKATYGSATRQVAGESVQEAMEEGINYISQKEAMLYAEDPVNYSPNSDRMIEHLADPEGIEAMVMGAAGGAIQTGFSELLTIKKEKAKEAIKNVNTKTAETKPGTKPKDDFMMGSAKLLDDYIAKRKGVKIGANAAETEAEINAIEDEYIDNDIAHMTTWGDQSMINGKIAHDKSVLEKKLDNNATPEDLDERRLAEKQLKKLERAKKIMDSDPNFWKYNNRPKVLSKALEVEDLNSTLNRLNDQASQLDSIGEDSSKMKAEAKKTEDLLTKAKTELAILKGDEGQAVEIARLAKEKEEAAKKAQDAAAQKNKNDSKSPGTKAKLEQQAELLGIDKRSGVEKPIPPKAKKSDVQRDPLHNFPINPSSYEEAVGTEAAPGPLYDAHNELVVAGAEQKSDKSQASIKAAVGTDENTIGIRTFKNNNGDLQVFTSIPEIPGVTPAIADSVEVATKADAMGPNMAKALREILGIAKDAQATGRDMSISIDGMTFRISEFDEWAKTAGQNGSALDTSNPRQAPPAGGLKLADLQAFLDFKLEQSAVEEDGDYTGGEPDGTLAVDKAKKDRAAKDIHRTTALAVNYAAEESTTTADRKATIGTGVINIQYLDNSDPALTSPGTKLIFKVHTEEVDTYNYDATGKVILNPDGSRSTTKRNAAKIISDNVSKPDSVKNELPIGVYVQNPDGSAGRLVGFLPESRWMNETADGDFVNLKNEDKVALAEEIARVEALRETIAEGYLANGEDATPMKAEITSVSSGSPFYGEPGSDPQSVTKNMPTLISDAEKTMGHQPFATVAGRTISFNGTAVDGVVNEEYIVDPSNSKQGSVLIMVPTANGGKIAVRGASKLLSDLPGTVANIISGIKAFVGQSEDALKARESFNKAFNTHPELTKMDPSDYKTLRNYMKQFVFIESMEAVNNSVGYDHNKRFVSVYQKKSGEIMIAYGTKGHGYTTIHVNSGKNIDAQLMKLSGFLLNKDNQIKHNFSTSNIDNAPVIGISQNKASVVAKTKAEMYMDTVSTYAKSAGKSSSGRTIYAIQPVLAFAPVVEEVKDEGPVTVGTKVIDSAIAKDVPSVDVDGDLDEDALNAAFGDPLAAAGVEVEEIIPPQPDLSDEEAYYSSGSYDEYLAATSSNPLMNIENYNDPHEVGDVIRRHCS